MIAREPKTQPVRHLFAYGTLLPDLAPPEVRPLIEELTRAQQATLLGARLYDLGDYPAAVPADAASTVRGRLYRLPGKSKPLLDRLDRYEEAGPGKSLFNRKIGSVRLSDGRRLQAWVYFYNRSLGNAPLIASGSYR
ncbi:MAG TPA: gamma-glutamylcyclotransferase family protein [Terriglobales bacterium]|nr:gamma-glutamylcyclotransferase family protein [Terriglobales bacterium]